MRLNHKILLCFYIFLYFRDKQKHKSNCIFILLRRYIKIITQTLKQNQKKTRIKSKKHKIAVKKIITTKKQIYYKPKIMAYKKKQQEIMTSDNEVIKKTR